MKSRGVIIVISIILFSCDLNEIDQSFISNVLGMNIRLNEEVFYIYEKKPNGIEMRFEMYSYNILNENDNLIKDGYPKRQSIPDGWETIIWKQTLSAEDEKRLDLLIQYDYEKSETKNKALKMRRLITQKENFYTYSYKEENEQITGMQLFVIDVVKCQFYEYELFLK